MRIGICDDEKKIMDIIAEKNLRLYPKAELLLFKSGDELLETDRTPDILFLDIQMPGKNGMETALEIRKRGWNTAIIFLTASEEYVFRAFDVGAFHYIVKPFSDEKFSSILKSAAKQRLIADREEGFVMVKSGEAHIKVFFRDIVYAEVFNRKIILHKLNEDIEYYGRLTDLEKQAGDSFFRTHRGYLVNMKYVVKYNASEIQLEKGTAFIAKQNYSEFVKSFLKYNRRSL